MLFVNNEHYILHVLTEVHGVKGFSLNQSDFSKSFFLAKPNTVRLTLDQLIENHAEI